MLKPEPRGRNLEESEHAEKVCFGLFLEVAFTGGAARVELRLLHCVNLVENIATNVKCTGAQLPTDTIWYCTTQLKLYIVKFISNFVLCDYMQ